MTTQNYNRVQILYNAEHEPYLYGIVHRVDGDPNNQWLEKPFVISKKMWNGEEVVYGTVKRLLEKIIFQLDRLKHFQLESQMKLDAAGITPLPQDGAQLPKSEVTDRIIDEQEELIEDVFLTTSVYVRILSEIFPQKFKKSKVRVYDYDGQSVAQIELSQITDLLVHNRYICIQTPYILDLLSDDKFLSKKPQMGLKINALEYFSEMEKVVNSITIKDLGTKLWGMAKQLSASSNIKDIIFLTQNLYTLGGSVVGSDMNMNSSPLNNILNRVAIQYHERMYPASSTRKPTEVHVSLFFGTPRFYLGPDLDQKQIRIEMLVGSNREALVSETLVIGYKEFFSGVIKASGNRKLHPNSVN